MSQEYVIITDSTSDLTAEMVRELELTVIPLTFTINGQEYENHPDGHTLSFDDFYALIREGKMSTTSALNSTHYIDVFEPFLKEGKDVLNIAFSSGLSTTYQSSARAVEELSAKYPDRKIISIDSRAACMGLGLLCYHAVQKKRAGQTIDEVAQWVTDNRLHMCHWVTVDDLHHLKRGGRVSATTAFVGTAIGIKPIIHVDDEGHLINVGKVRGKGKSLAHLVDVMEELAVNPSEQVIFISHSDALEDALALEQMVHERFGVKEVHINYIGPVIGSHTGTGTVALFFLGTKR